MRVLLVDDDPIMRRATTRMLPRFQVDAVGGAAEALSAIATDEHYAAVVVDASLGAFPDRDGIELVRELRERGFVGGIVLVSGIVKEHLEEEARRAGADAALLKGDFDGSELRMTIERVIAVRSPPPPGTTDELPPDLRALAGDVLDVFAQERSLEAEQAYRLALLAQAAFASVGRDWSVIEACARAVGLSRQTLQPYATVAARWSAPELRQLLAARRNVRGEPISISHLVLLARLSNPARDQWTERVFDEGLTVRQLRELLRNESQD
jgi:CheY-like chemotaxis protein